MSINRLMFSMALQECDLILASAAKTLLPMSVETLELLAREYNEVANTTGEQALTGAAREKAQALVALYAAAAEYKRCATRVAKAMLAHALEVKT